MLLFLHVFGMPALFCASLIFLFPIFFCSRSSFCTKFVSDDDVFSLKPQVSLASASFLLQTQWVPLCLPLMKSPMRRLKFNKAIQIKALLSAISKDKVLNHMLIPKETNAMEKKECNSFLSHNCSFATWFSGRKAMSSAPLKDPPQDANQVTPASLPKPTQLFHHCCFCCKKRIEHAGRSA